MKFKRKEGISGIYLIINLINGKYYVGSSKNILGAHSGRVPEHFTKAKGRKHKNEYFQKAVNKYGIENFTFLILEYVEPEKLLEIEQKYLDQAKLEEEFNYNLCYTAGGGARSEEGQKIWRIKIDQWHKNNKHPHLGVPMPQEVRDKISETTKGRKLKPEHRKKLTEINQKRKGIPRIEFAGENNPSSDKTIYTFWNFITNEIFQGNRCTFKEKIKCGKNAIKNILIGKCISINREWTIVEKYSDNPETCEKLGFAIPDIHNLNKNSGKNNPRCDHKIYNFYNKVTQEIFSGSKYDFYTKYNFGCSEISRIISKENTSHKDWIILRNN